MPAKVALDCGGGYTRLCTYKLLFCSFCSLLVHTLKITTLDGALYWFENVQVVT